MNSDSAPSLRMEDRADFARALDEALSLAPRPANGGSGSEPDPDAERLRAMALNAMESIAAGASAEFQEYRKQREQAAAERRDAALSGRSVQQRAPGAGLVAMVAVLTPILAAIAALIFLVLGYALRAVLTPEPAIAAPLRSAGWVFAVVAALGVLAGMAGVLVTALRNSARAVLDDPFGELPPEVAAAREAWLEALVRRGILPFLDEARARAGGDAPRSPSARSGGVRDESDSSTDFTSPDFSSRDFTGSDDDGASGGPGPRFSSPRFSSPDFTSPDFTSPDVGGSDLGGPEHEER